MRRLILATFAGAALIAGAGTTSAQAISGGNSDRVSGWTTTPVAGASSSDHSAKRKNTTRSRSRHAKPRNATATRGGYKTPGFGSQEPMPQSPPGGY